MTIKPLTKVIKKNSPAAKYKDIYHYLQKITWMELFFIYVIFFLSINFIFALFYYLVPESLEAVHHDFRTAFFFSVQTFSTVGYGTVSPASLYANIVVVAEIMIGVVSMAVSTGLVFAKFSKPQAKIIYSNNMLITKFDGQNVLMFRMANARSNQIISAKVELHHLYPTTTVEGKNIIRFSELKLIKNYSPVFALSWSVFHPITVDSPFFGKTLEEIEKLRWEFIVILNGTDGTYSQNIFDTHGYKSKSILKDHDFVDILHLEANGTRVIDYNKFHQTVPHGS
jgi:inward rectifier potassium channel